MVFYQKMLANMQKGWIFEKEIRWMFFLFTSSNDSACTRSIEIKKGKHFKISIGEKKHRVERDGMLYMYCR